jgi:hypothetical protein
MVLWSQSQAKTRPLAARNLVPNGESEKLRMKLHDTLRLQAAYETGNNVKALSSQESLASSLHYYNAAQLDSLF